MSKKPKTEEWVPKSSIPPELKVRTFRETRLPDNRTMFSYCTPKKDARGIALSSGDPSSQFRSLLAEAGYRMVE